MNQKLIKLCMIFLIAATSLTVLAQGKEGGDPPKCKAEEGHTLSGYCTSNMEGRSICVTSSNECDCCHSGS